MQFVSFICLMLNAKYRKGVLRWLHGKESTCDAGDGALILGWGRSPGRGNGNLFHRSCLENCMDRGAWRTTVLGITKESNTTEVINKYRRVRYGPSFLRVLTLNDSLGRGY